MYLNLSLRERVELGRVKDHDSNMKVMCVFNEWSYCKDDWWIAYVEEVRELEARGERVRQGEDHAERKEWEVEDQNLD